MADYFAMAAELRAGRHPRRGLPRQPEELRQPVEIRRQTPARPSRSSRAPTRTARGVVQIKDLVLGAQIAAEATHGGMEVPARPESRCRAPTWSPRSRGWCAADDPQGPRSRPRRSGCCACFQAAGALPVEADILQPADTLLDLYGEDIRARAYVTQDPLRGELMLRPDFTVPVVEMHMAHGADPARYCYAGEVFRRQEDDGDRPVGIPAGRLRAVRRRRSGRGRCRGLRAVRRAP